VDNKPNFDGVTINPPLVSLPLQLRVCERRCQVLGPIIHQVDSPDSLNTSVGS
jgi:hypothetical protein